VPFRPRAAKNDGSMPRSPIRKAEGGIGLCCLSNGCSGGRFQARRKRQYTANVRRSRKPSLNPGRSWTSNQVQVASGGGRGPGAVFLSLCFRWVAGPRGVGTRARFFFDVGCVAVFLAGGGGAAEINGQQCSDWRRCFYRTVDHLDPEGFQVADHFGMATILNHTDIAMNRCRRLPLAELLSCGAKVIFCEPNAQRWRSQPNVTTPHAQRLAARTRKCLDVPITVKTM